MKSKLYGWIFWLFLFTAISLTGYFIIKKHTHISSNGNLVVRSDVLVYVSAASDLLAGKDIYNAIDKEDPYVYPPFYAFLNIPLLLFDPLTIDIFWYILNVILIGIIIYQSYFIFTGKMFKSATRSEKWIYAGLSILFALRYIVRNAQQGNINLFLLFLITLSIYLLQKTRKDYWSSIIGIAAAIKVFPLIFFLYFAARKQWKSAGYFLLAFIVATFIPSIVIGFSKNWEYLQSFLLVIDRRFSPSGIAVENFSVWGTLGRVLSHQPAFFTSPENAVYINLVNLNLKIVRYLFYTFNFILMVICYFALRMEMKGTLKSPLLPREGAYVLILLTMHLSSILMEDHHMVTYLVPFLYVILAWRYKCINSNWFPWFIFSSGIISILLNYDIIVPLFGKYAYMILLSLSLPTLAVGIILFSLVLSTIFENYRKSLHNEAAMKYAENIS